jgi:microsomal epoxide hydrolase
MAMSLPGEPFRIEVAEDDLRDLRDRLGRTRFPKEEPRPPWAYGTSLDFMRRVRDHWLHRFDWRQWETRINRFEQRLVDVEDCRVHVLVEKGSGTQPLPLIITHGWPGSFLEFIDIIDKLAHPERFGGRVEDAFTVVVPSIPGYGYSPPPPRMLTPPEISRLWSKLAVDAFGFERYVAQGGDWGSAITGWLALDHPDRLLAAHLNTVGLVPSIGPGDPPLSAEEQDWLRRSQVRMTPESAYQKVLGTKPQTLAYAQSDSPMGLAAWILEKFHGWTVPGEDRDPPFPLDHLLANVTLYWLQGPNAPSWLYVWLERPTQIGLAPGARTTVPCGFTLFPNDLIVPPPRSWVERAFNVQYLATMPHGGHFPAMENGDLLVEEMRRFFRGFR